MDSKQVATTIIEQMGGFRALKLMVGMHTTMVLNARCGGVQFRFKGSRKANTCRVILDANDTYTFELTRVGKTVKEVVKLDGVYCDQLAPLFEQHTGLTLTVPRFVTR